MVMHKCYHHLSQSDRTAIMYLSQLNLNAARIARKLGRARSTISRELRRNAWAAGDLYLDECAQLRTERRRRQARLRYRLKDSTIRSYVLTKIEAGWSPEIIAGRIKQDSPGQTISHEAIYQYIYHPDTPNRDQLIGFLRRHHCHRRNRRSGRRSRNIHIPNRISIHDRPVRVATRHQFGHWEGDSLLSSRSSTTLYSLIERKTRLLRLTRIWGRDGDRTAAAVIQQLGSRPRTARRTLTLDTGFEHFRHERITSMIGIRCYFCDPYSAWQRGTNEHVNGLIRWYLPKGTDFRKLTRADIEQVEYTLNSRPMKCLDFKTPLEAAAQLVALRH